MSTLRAPLPRRRVVITGLGLVTPLGLEVETTWSALLDGQCGVSTIEHFDASAFRSQIGGVVKDFDPLLYLNKQEARRADPFIQYGVAAALQAVKDARLEVSEANEARVGVSMGSGIGGITNIEAQKEVLDAQGPAFISPLTVPQAIINTLSGYVSILTGAKGPCISMVSACATGAHSIGEAARKIERGDAEVMIAGGAEAAVTPISLAGFCAARALTQRNDDPAKASRPWDRDRDGFVLADGAGAVVLESLESALQRGAPIYAELLGYATTGDAHHLTFPSRQGEGARRCMEEALADAGVSPQDVSAINAHATSTRAGDLAEAQALAQLFGPERPEVPVTSTKSMTGHLLGAAGAIEAVFSVLSIRDQLIPPTINVDHPDDDCQLNIVRDEPRRTAIDVALSNSFGFGGTNAALVLGRVDVK